MGMVWETYHKGVPLLGVPGITLDMWWHLAWSAFLNASNFLFVVEHGNHPTSGTPRLGSRWWRYDHTSDILTSWHDMRCELYIVVFVFACNRTTFHINANSVFFFCERKLILSWGLLVNKPWVRLQTGSWSFYDKVDHSFFKLSMQIPVDWPNCPWLESIQLKVFDQGW